MNIAEVSKMIKDADVALSTLESYQKPQIEEKSKMILSQVCVYIQNKLEEANWIYNGVRCWDDIMLSRNGILSLGDWGAISCLNPVAQITVDGIKYLNPLRAYNMDTLISYWSVFKTSLDESIENAMQKKQEQLARRISKLAYDEDKLNNFII